MFKHELFDSKLAQLLNQMLKRATDCSFKPIEEFMKKLICTLLSTLVSVVALARETTLKKQEVGPVSDIMICRDLKLISTGQEI